MQQDEPLKVGSATWTQVSASYHCSFGIRTGGTLWAWGDGPACSGVAGSATPVQVGSAIWTEVSTAINRTVAIKSDGTLWAWGSNSYGELGDGALNPQNAPIKIGSATNWASVSAGGASFSIAIKTDGTLWAWGQTCLIGQGTCPVGGTGTPTQIGSATNWSRISAGFIHALALKTDGTLWAWGVNDNGELGDGTTTTQYAPVHIGTAAWSLINAGNGGHAIKTDGTLWGWGPNNYGQLGDGTRVGRLAPVALSPGIWARAVAGYGSHSLAIKGNGAMQSSGLNQSGQLGNGKTTIETAPVQIP